MSYQAGQVGSNLEGVSTQISSRTNDLDALSNGAHQLADSLEKVRDQINGASQSMTAMTSTLSQVQQQLTGSKATQLFNSIQTYANNAGTQTAMNNVANSAAPMLAALNNSSQCDADAACSAGRTSLQQLASVSNGQTQTSAQNVLATAQKLSTLMQSASSNLQSAGITSPAAAQQKIAQMQQGANSLADGSKLNNQQLLFAAGRSGCVKDLGLENVGLAPAQAPWVMVAWFAAPLVHSAFSRRVTSAPIANANGTANSV